MQRPKPDPPLTSGAERMTPRRHVGRRSPQLGLARGSKRVPQTPTSPGRQQGASSLSAIRWMDFLQWRPLFELSMKRSLADFGLRSMPRLETKRSSWMGCCGCSALLEGA